MYTFSGPMDGTECSLVLQMDPSCALRPIVCLWLAAHISPTHVYSALDHVLIIRRPAMHAPSFPAQGGGQNVSAVHKISRSCALRVISLVPFLAKQCIHFQAQRMG